MSKERVTLVKVENRSVNQNQSHFGSPFRKKATTKKQDQKSKKY